MNVYGVVGVVKNVQCTLATRAESLGILNDNFFGLYVCVFVPSDDHLLQTYASNTRVKKHTSLQLSITTTRNWNEEDWLRLIQNTYYSQ